MPLPEYETYKKQIIDQYGMPEYEYDGAPLNQSAKMLKAFVGKQMHTKSQAAKVVTDTVKELGDKYNTVQLPESKLLDKDLKGFDNVQKDILRAFFSDRSIKPSVLAKNFNRSYQYVAGLLKSKEVLRLIAKYFKEDLSEYTQLSLLKGVKAGDPRLTVASAEYLGILSQKGLEDNEYKSEEIESDPFTIACLQSLSDWLLNPNSPSITFNKPKP